jgi:hypothetical protein
MSPPPEGRDVITYTVTTDGEKDALNSTRIDFEFSEAVPELDEGSVNLIVDTGNVERGGWTGGGKLWSLGIAVKTPGDVKVKISRDGIEDAEKTVTVHREFVQETVAAPEAYPAGRTFQDSISVALESATEGAAIYYTLDNSVPEQGESGSIEYAGPIVLDTHSILKARAFKEGLEPSVVLREVYTKAGAVLGTVAAPRAAPETPLTFYTDTLTISLTSETEGAAIYYTLDGSKASKAGTLYAGPFAMGEGAAYGKITLKAIAVKDFMNDSEAISAVYEKGNPALPYARASVFSVPAGGIDPGGAVALDSATEGASIYYTLDESTPTTETGTLYAGPLVITERTLIKAIAVKEGMNASEAAASKYLPRINAGGINWLDITAEILADLTDSGNEAIAWNGTRYVYVPRVPGRPAAYSADLIHWTAGEGNIFASTTYRDPHVAWGDPAGSGRFVAVNGHNVSYSPDGVTWTESTVTDLVITATENFTTITWGGPAGQELFVAGASKGSIYWSSDGIAWTKVVDSTLGSRNVTRLIWGGGKFVALMAGGALAYSPDGKEWVGVIMVGTYEVDKLTEVFRDLIYTGTEYIINGSKRDANNPNQFNPMLWSSNDAETWTATILPVGSYSHLLYKDGKFFAVLTRDRTSTYAYSTDKINWIAFMLPSIGRLYTVNEAVELIVFGHEYFLRQVPIILSQIYCQASTLRPSFANSPALPSPLTSALRQYPRYAFPYIMYHTIKQPLYIHF